MRRTRSAVGLSPARVTLASGQTVPLSPPPDPAELVGALRARVAAALAVDVERVVLLAGTRILQNHAEASSSSGGRELTALVTEAIMDPENPQHVAEYASDIFRGCLRRSEAPADDGCGGLERAAEPMEEDACDPMDLEDQEEDEEDEAESEEEVEEEGLEEPQRGSAQASSTPSGGPSRSALIDWLVEEHQNFGLRTETLFLAVRIFDTFLQRRNVASRDLRLLGVVALLIASKFEDIDPPEIRELAYITGHQCTSEDIKRMEVVVLSVLQFDIAKPTALHFMSRYWRASQCSELQSRLIHYIVELALVEDIVLQHPAHRLAAAAVVVANRLAGQSPAWPQTMVNYTGQSEDELHECAAGLHRIFRDSPFGAVQTVQGKLDQDPELRDYVDSLMDSLDGAVT